MIMTMTLKITKATTIIMTITHHDYDVNGDDAEDEDKAKYEEYDDKK